MTQEISLTKNYLIPNIKYYTYESNSTFKREILTRLIALVTVFFRGFDLLSNTLCGIGKTCGRALRAIHLNIASQETVSDESIGANLKEIKNILWDDAFLPLKLLFFPRHTIKAKIIDTKSDSLTTIFHQTIAQNQLATMSPEELDKNWKLNDYFPNIRVINLDDKPGSADPTKFKRRLDRITDDLNNIGGATFERLRATYGALELSREVWSRVQDNSFNLTGEEQDRTHKAQAGCYMSHYRAVKEASDKYDAALKELEEAKALLKNSNNLNEEQNALHLIEGAQAKVKRYSNVLVLEDDNGMGFVKKPDANTLATVEMKGSGIGFRKVMQELPQDWHMLYFCTAECGKEGKRWIVPSPQHSEHLNRLDYGLLCNALAINHTAYPVILKALSKIDDPTKPFRPLDHEYAMLHGKLNVFSPKNPLAYQGAGDSSISVGTSNEPWNGTWDRGF